VLKEDLHDMDIAGSELRMRSLDIVWRDINNTCKHICVSYVFFHYKFKYIITIVLIYTVFAWQFFKIQFLANLVLVSLPACFKYGCSTLLHFKRSVGMETSS